MNIYFLETEFSINDQVTWYSNGKRGLGSVDKIVDDEDSCSIIEDETERKYTIPTYSLNKVHPMHRTIMKMDENIQENDDIFSGIKDKDIEQLYLYLNCTKEEVYDYLFIDGFESIFIYDEIMNEDDTNEMILMKLSHYCCSKVPSQYIYAIYTDNETNQINAIGFNYHGPEIMHPDEILSIDICEMINKEKDFTDMYNNNHISPTEIEAILQEHPAVKEGRALQLLTHPIWWTIESGNDVREKLDRFLLRRFDFLRAELASNCSAYPQAFKSLGRKEK